MEVAIVSSGPGGSALNTAWHLAAQDVRCALRAAVGEDRHVQILAGALQAESKIADAASSLVALKGSTTASCVAMFGPSVDRTFLSSYGAARLATVGQLLGSVEALDATHVHVGGFYVCKGLHAGLPDAVRRLKARGVKVSMDPNFDAAGEWTPEAMRSVVRGPCAVDVLLPSEVWHPPRVRARPIFRGTARATRVTCDVLCTSSSTSPVACLFSERSS